MADACAGSQYKSAPFCECSFSEEVCGEVYFFKILQMRDCLFIWIGNGPTFDHLAVSIPSSVVLSFMYFYLNFFFIPNLLS